MIKFGDADVHERNSGGSEMYEFVRSLFPLCRSLTGNGVRATLQHIKLLLPDLNIHEVPSGTRAYDWTVPDEWNPVEAWIADESGKRILDFADNNLHLVGYSEPVDAVIELEELKAHLHSLPDMPAAIPYVTTYYKRRWGFCLSHDQINSLKPGKYRVKIDASLAPGSLTYGELILPGQSEQECFVSTYVCHPSMANNELSGPAVATWLAAWVAQQGRQLTYRFIFIPETIGSIVYLSQHKEQLQRKVVAGFNLSCVGDERMFSYLPSRHGKTLADRAALHVLRHHQADYTSYSFLERGSDERQYCAPGIDLPVCSIMRSKYGTYPEYHTSLDNLNLVSAKGLGDSLSIHKRVISLLDSNVKWRASTLCEPQLGKRGLYPTLSTPNGALKVRTMMNILAYADGSRDLIQLCDDIGADAFICLPIIQELVRHNLLVEAVE